jgi:hypothetical protein
MVGAALEALLGTEPSDEAVEAALATIPAPALDEAFRGLVRQHGVAALPLLRRCLAGRPERATAAAGALGRLPAPEAAAALARLEAETRDRGVRTAARRALYRLRQVGVVPPSPARPAPASPPARLGEAWTSAVDGTGARGIWVTLAGPYGERTLVAAVVSDEVGLLDAVVGAVSKKRLGERLRALRADSPLPWVAVPAAWAWAGIVRAAMQAREAGRRVPAELTGWIERLPAPAPGPPPIHARLPPAAAADPRLLERSAELLARTELAGWCLDPASLASEAVEWMQALESRLVVSDHTKAARLAALVDRVADAHLDAPSRTRWAGRLEDQAYVLFEQGCPTEAAMAVAVARALADPACPPWRIPFVRALVERSLHVAGEVATGRLPAELARRGPRGGESDAAAGGP